MKIVFILILTTFAVNTSALTYDVKEDFGAIGDGSANDTIPIQNAIDAAIAAKGGVVLLPIGEYLHDGLTIYGNSVKLTGEVETGATGGGTRLVYNGNGGSHVFIGTSSAKSIYIENLTFLAKNDQTNSGEAIKAYGKPKINCDSECEMCTSGVDISLLNFSNLQIIGRDNLSGFGSLYNGIVLDGVVGAHLNNIRLLGLTGDAAIKLSATERRADVFRLTNVLFNGANFANSISTTTNGVFISEGVSSVKTNAVDMLRAKNGFVIGSDNTPNTNPFENSCNIIPDEPEYIYLLNVTAENSLIDGIRINRSGAYAEIKNCYAHVSGVHGINLRPDTGPIHIAGCTVQRNGVTNNNASGIWVGANKGGSITGNFVANNRKFGINLTSLANGFSISSNNSSGFDGLQDYGIILNNGSKNNVVSNNILSNNNSHNLLAGSLITNTIINDNVEFDDP